MAEYVEIPRLPLEDVSNEPGRPGWRAWPRDGKFDKPSIRCNCGKFCCIDLHHVHADGRVTASFFHQAAASFTQNGKTYRGDPKGCGWHVFLKLKDYDLGEFPPTP